jgi:hypothetical protein
MREKIYLLNIGMLMCVCIYENSFVHVRVVFILVYQFEYA